MNNYDDIKRFKAKVKLEDIDYKEIPNQKKQGFMRGFTILEQLAQEEPSMSTAGAITPPPLAVDEFNQIGAPLLNTSPVVMPPQFTHQQQPVVPQQKNNAAMPKTGNPLDDNSRFNRLFSKNKTASQLHTHPVGRDTPLKSLLELIALCR